MDTTHNDDQRQHGDAGSHELRPEEVIVEIYRQRSALAERGVEPSRVVMDARHYRLIQEYRARLGEVAEGHSDYMGRYELFDLEICIESVTDPRVE